MSTVFADDVSLYQSTGKGMQRVADGVLIFCGLTGMRCNVDKTRWLSLNGAVTEGDGIYGRQWLPVGQWGAVAGQDELMKSFGAEEYRRYLGMVQNGDGEIDGMLEAVEAEVREEAAVLSRKRISLAGMAYLSNAVILPGVLYKLKFSHANVKQIDRIQDPIEPAGRCGKEGRTDCGGAQSAVWRIYGVRMEKVVG